MTIFLCSLVGAAMLTCAGIVGYFLRAHQERASTSPPADAVPIDHVAGSVVMDCRACRKNNRVPYDRLLKRPTCGACKERLLPYKRVVFETLRRVTDVRLDREMDRTWTDYDKIWTTIHRGLFGMLSKHEPTKTTSTNDASVN